MRQGWIGEERGLHRNPPGINAAFLRLADLGVMVFRWHSMFSLPPRLFFWLLAAAFAGEARAEDTVRIRQITPPNPVADPVVLANRMGLTPAAADGVLASLPGAIEIRFSAPVIGCVWDPVECRLLYVWRGESPEAGLIQVAEGPAPLAATTGVYGAPQYFGYRIVAGAPEFLYRLGRLAIEERIEVSADGSKLTQRWKIYQAGHDVVLAVPERWKQAVEAPGGSWSESFLKIPKDKAADVALSWLLGKAPELPTLPGTWKKIETAKAASVP